MQTQTQATLSDLAVRYPAASRIFTRERLDFCCHGRRSLESACAELGLDPAAVLAEITTATPTPDESTWTNRPLTELVDFILERYHETLRAELPQLIELSRKVETKHAAKPGCPTGLTGHLENIHREVLDHLAKEEMVLFPAIASGAGRQAVGPVHVMEQEHHEHAANLQRTRELTQDLTAPPEACPSWQALYTRLRELEVELMEHIHLENNVLFPRALCE